MEDGITLRPITHNSTHAWMARWIQNISERTGQAGDVFIVLDLATWAPRNGTNPATLQQVQHGVGSEKWRREQSAAGRIVTNLSVLQGALASLTPHAFVDYSSVPFCKQHPAVCAASPGTDQLWWEQVAKHEACLRQVRLAEQRRGERYSVITKIRSDFSFAALWHVASPMRVAWLTERAVEQEKKQRSSGHESSISETALVAPWSYGTNRWGCYRESDWFAAASRSAADLYFNLTGLVTPEWLRCFWLRYSLVHARESSVNSRRRGHLGCLAGSENMLVDWLIWHRVNVSHSADVSQRLHSSIQGGKARDAQMTAMTLGSGFLTDAFEWNRHAYKPAAVPAWNLSVDSHRQCHNMMEARAGRRAVARKQ